MTKTSSNSFSGATSDPGIELNPAVAVAMGGPSMVNSFVVSKFDDYGGKKRDGEVMGGSDNASRLKKLLIGSMGSRGNLMPGYIMTPNGPVKDTGITKQASVSQPQPAQMITIVQPKTKKGKPGKAIQNFMQTQEPMPPMQEPVHTPTPKVAPVYTVVFEIESGKIRSTVESILEDQVGLMLVYEDTEHISFIPKQGDDVTIVLPGNRKITAMFLGMQFSWANSNQQCVVFAKTGQG